MIIRGEGSFPQHCLSPTNGAAEHSPIVYIRDQGYYLPDCHILTYGRKKCQAFCDRVEECKARSLVAGPSCHSENPNAAGPFSSWQ